MAHFRGLQAAGWQVLISVFLCSCRFRLRYCSYYDCYYLHWDDAVCPPLARINGVKNGLYSSSGVTRYIDQENDEVRVYVCVCVCMCVCMCVRIVSHQTRT